MLSSGEDDGEVDWREDTLLDVVGILNEEVGSETELVSGGDQVVEADKALLELLRGVVVEASIEEGENCREVLLECRTIL